MKKRNHARCGRLISLIVCLFLLSLVLGCSSQKVEPSSTRVIETNTDPDIFTMQSPNQFPLTPVRMSKVSDEVHVNCAVMPDVNRSVPVVSLGGGRVVDIKAKLGDYVERGQVLLLINSPDLAGAFSDYQKAKADQVLAEKQLARAQLLYDKGAIAQAELENAQDVHAKADVDVRTAAAHVKVLGGDINSPASLLPLRAPISGTIVDQQITGGTGVRSLDNQPALFTIADLSEVWVVCDVYQDMLPRVHEGDVADITVAGYAHDQFPGRVINISQVLDPNTRTAKVRIELPNPRHILRSGMYVTAMFRGKELIDRIMIPASAVVHLHDKDCVYVPLEGNQFRRVAIELGTQGQNGEQQVITGLKPNDQVVTNALQFASAAEE